jgi:signal transduction histidine kinase
MLVAPLPESEEQRIEALLRYKVLDTDAESCYDDLVEIAAQICQTPIALVSLVDVDRQWFKAKTGVDAEETHRDLAFCAHAILNPDDILVVTDATKDERFYDNALVTEEPKIRFYAGMPLVTHDGHALGTLCVIDTKPKSLAQSQLNALKALARQVVGQLELRLKTMQLESTNQAKDKIFSMLSHDLKGPFNSILGFSQTLAKKAESMSKETISLSAQSIYKSAQQNYDLMDNLLQWSKFQLGGFTFTPEKVEIKALTDQVVTNLAKAAENKSIKLINYISSPINIQGDKVMLNSVMLNLTNNAIKFTPDEGSITIECKETEKDITIAVKDSGVGMTTEQRQNIFNIGFVCTNKGTKGEIGNGIGLLLCKDCIEQHQGKIWVESELGAGSQFYFRLPK